jgi:hypothetical protein
MAKSPTWCTTLKRRCLKPYEMTKLSESKDKHSNLRLCKILREFDEDESSCQR